jgi:hypothetical protein
MKYQFLLAVFTSLIFSCSTPQTDNPTSSTLLPKSQLTLMNTKKVSIDSITDASSLAFYTTINQKPFVIKRANTGENTIFKFSNFDDNEKWEVKIPTQGPKAINPIDLGFLVNQDESILIHQFRTFNFFNTTKTGEIVAKYEIDKDLALENYKIQGVNISPSSPMLFIENIIYFRPAYSIERTSPQYYQEKVLYGLNTQTEELYGIGEWPAFMKKGVYFGEYAFIQNYITIGDTLALSFPLDPSLHLYSLGSREKIGEVYLPSKDILNIPPEPDAGLNLADESREGYSRENNMEYIYPIGQFWRLLYDEKANLLYRFVFTPSPIKDFEGNLIPPMDRPISVQILNSKLELLNEVSLEKAKYNLSNTFAYAGKLYLELKPDIENDPSAEDYAIYEVFEFVEG